MKRTAFSVAITTFLMTTAVANAQEAAQPPAEASEATAAPAAAAVEEIVVTGSRIQHLDFVANSPVVTVSEAQLKEHADITLDTYLNTLVQVNPAGTTTSNNPPNNGQSNVNLRGLGTNRNLVLIDGRRAMVSASDQTVDLNTIPAALIEQIEIVSGGAGAVYGADAVAGAVNLKLKDDFEGLDLTYNFSNATGPWDAEEYSISGVLGANFADERGNAVVAFDFSSREPMIKSQRDFSSVATATTSFLPEGIWAAGSGAKAVPGGPTLRNPPSQAAVDALFQSYNASIVPGSVPASGTFIGFNNDGSLFSRGTFNSPLNVQNFRYPIDSAVNTRIFPDVYSYNFDAVNILRLPLDRRSFMGKLDYEFDSGIKAFALLGWTEYKASSALAPTPITTVDVTAVGENAADEATSPLLASGFTSGVQLVVPSTNPFIPADFRTLLNSRTGDNPKLIGSGATEPFFMRQRTLSAGLRLSTYKNTVVQYTFGLSGELPLLANAFGSDWRWELYGSEGRTEIAESQQGNIDTQRLQGLLEASDGGDSLCAGGFNPFGRKGISPECINYLEVSNTLTSNFKLRVASGYISGTAAELPAGPLQVVLGLEYRGFYYQLDPGAVSGPISGFTTQNAADAENSFRDIFAEASIPIVKDKPYVESLDLVVGWRYSINEAQDNVTRLKTPKNRNHTYKFELGWVPIESLRARFSWQRAVRAPNFGELFDGGGSAPQYFDPCSTTSAGRRGPNGAALTLLCEDTGVASTATYVQTPGTQLSVDTAANPALTPEEASTYTIGLAFTSPWGGALESLQASIDYFNIDIANPIIADPSVNIFVANCYNYYGQNPTYDVNHPDCTAIGRAGGDILAFEPGATGEFPGINGGRIKASGLDVIVNYGLDVLAGRVDLNMSYSRTLGSEQQERPGLPTLSYKGTAAYFGSGLGTSNPTDRLYLTGRYQIGEVGFDMRARLYSSMKNRMGIQFPGEAFAKIPSVGYWDMGATWNFGERFPFFGEGSTFRLGLNNVLDKKPPQYSPNVQSGTDPSLYDVIGRRVFFQVTARY